MQAVGVPVDARDQRSLDSRRWRYSYFLDEVLAASLARLRFIDAAFSRTTCRDGQPFTRARD